MRDVSIEVKVGTVVIMAVVILLYGIIWVKDYRFNVEHYEYSCYFPQVGTLDIGDPVSVLGVDKGEIKDIKLFGNNVLVVFSLAVDVELKKDARFKVMNVGLMGERYVAVWPGNSNEMINLEMPSTGKYDTGIPEVMGMMGEGIDEIRNLVAQIEGTVGKTGKGKEIRQIIDDLFNITGKFSRFVDENQTMMKKVVEDMSNVAAKMSNFADSNSSRMKTTVDNFADASVKMNKLVSNLDELSQDFHNLADKVREGEGTIGKAFADDSLYLDLRRAVTNLDSLVTDFKAHPKKYIHLSIF